MDYELLLAIRPYSLDRSGKKKMFGEWLTELTEYHRHNCIPYERLLNAMDVQPDRKMEEEEIPMLPINLFKNMELKSIAPERIFKIVTSSGTGARRYPKFIWIRILPGISRLRWRI